MRAPSPRPAAPARRAARLARALACAAVLPVASACTVRVGGVPVTIPGPAGWPGPESRPAPRRPGPAGSGRAPAARVLATADDYLGVPYKWGGTSPRTGFDCSGYVQYVYRREGVELPRTSRQQAVAGQGRPTRWDAAGPGDLVMFAEPGEAISHVAFYAGDGRILHSTSSGGGVRFDDLGTRRGRWYRERLVAVRRVSGRGPAVARGLLASMGLATAPLDPPDRAPR
jgi:cell wall-associated NlpC family hydrolase